MCGIVGQFRFDNSALETPALGRAVSALGHRGPDDGTWWQEGPFFFGHRRLSIIDLALGIQPMCSTDGRLVVTFNGEIYNYIELRQELIERGYSFRTGSDTEVLLVGYREWGVDLPSRLVGMFAFAIADLEAETLFLARDRFGEKPLLYVDSERAVSFASEMRPLLGLQSVSRELDESALAAYLCLNYVPGDATLVRSVRRVSPATWRLYGRSGLIDEAQYWDARAAAAPMNPVGFEDALAQLQVLIDDAVRLTLRSDVPVGIFLSGGIDSSLIAESAQRAGRLTHAFCLAIGEESYSEWDLARQTASRLEIPITKVVLDHGAMQDFLAVVAHGDDPLADSSGLAVFTLAREAAKHNKVVLGGDGGDELFGGYLTYQASLWHNTVSRVPRAVRSAIANSSTLLPIGESKVSATYKAWRYLRAVDEPTCIAHFTWNGAWLPDEAATFMRYPSGKTAARAALARLAARHQLPPRPSLTDLQLADIGDYLPNDILTKGDRMTMAHGLELRAPFLNQDLAVFGLRLPPEYKAPRRGPLKRILRELARRKYGDTIATAKKQGFSIPVHSWLRHHARDLMQALLSANAIGKIDLLEVSAVQRAMDQHLSGRRSYGFELWGLMVLSAWYDACIVRSPAPPSVLPRRIETGVETSSG